MTLARDTRNHWRTRVDTRTTRSLNSNSGKVLRIGSAHYLFSSDVLSYSNKEKLEFNYIIKSLIDIKCYSKEKL